MIEDDPELAEIISRYLSRFDIEVSNAEEPYLGLAMLDDGEFDLLILDLTLPGIDGLELIPKIRESSSIPIIISSARDDIVDKVIGLERGADDYLPKPYNPRELEARIKSILRRRVVNSEVAPADSNKVFELDEKRIQIHFRGVLLSLTPAEYDIMAMLINRKHGVVSRMDFIYESDNISDDASEKNIDVMISRLRAKLAKIDPDFTYIKSARGVGYQLLIP
jgi:two-component system OmpR family response regulator